MRVALAWREWSRGFTVEWRSLVVNCCVVCKILKIRSGLREAPCASSGVERSYLSVRNAIGNLLSHTVPQSPKSLL